MEIVVSVAVSLDGYLDDASDLRLKLSGVEDWREVELLRAECDAILVGAGTLRADDPSLAIRDELLRQKRLKKGMKGDIVRVTVSSSGDVDLQSKFFADDGADKILITDNRSLQKKFSGLAQVELVESINAENIEQVLRNRGFKRLMVEGGGEILTMFLSAGVVDRVRFAVAPFFVGDSAAPRFVKDGRFIWGKENRMHLESVEQLGDMAVMHYVNEDKAYMKMAVEQSRNSMPTDDAFRVGAVIVTEDKRVFCGFTHENGGREHAEEVAIGKALEAGAELVGAAIYSSLEPCSTRSSKPKSCTQLIIDHGFRRVLFALEEPDYFVDCVGEDLLKEGGVEVVVMRSFADYVREINSHIIKK